MTQYNDTQPTGGTLCTNCQHVIRPEAFCRRFTRTLGHNPPRVITCSGFREAADPANEPVRHPGYDRIDRALMVIAFVWVTAWTVGALPANGQGGGYPAPENTRGATPTVWWTPGGPTNTPVPESFPALLPTEEGRAAWAVAAWRVWLPEVAR